MKVLGFPLTRIALLFVAGILCAFYFLPSPDIVFWTLGIAFYIFIISFLFSIKRINQKTHFAIITYLLSFLLGVTTQIVHNDYFDEGNYIHLIEKQDKKYTISITLREKLKTTAYNERYVANVNFIDGTKTQGKILLNIRNDSLSHDLDIGSNLLLRGNIYRHKSPYNPNQFDYGKYLENKSILSQVYADVRDIKVSNEVTKNIWYYSAKFRNTIIKNLKKSGFNEKELNVVNALILGQQQDISPDIMLDYQYAGAVHVLSVSGLHVGYILVFLNFLLMRVPKTSGGNLFRFLVIVFSLWGFAIVAGLSPSVVRSVTMFSFVAMGMHLKRKTNSFHTLLVSMLLILIFEPSFLFDVGFQLSYLALFFILWLQPLLSNLWIPGNKVYKYSWDIITVSFAAQIGTFPLSIYYFHQFPGLFFVTNLIILPVLGIIMALGVFVMVWASFGIVPLIFVKVLEWSIFGLNWIIGWIASFESFILKDISFNIYMEVLLYAFISMAILWLEKKTFKRLVFCLSAFILFQLSLIVTRYHHQTQNELLVFHSKKSSILVERMGDKVKAIGCNIALEGIDENRDLQSYLIANFSRELEKEQLRNVLYFNNKRIMVLDSSGIYPETIRPDVLVLTQSPRINLDRVLLDCKPEIIIADGSNFKSYIERWRATCRNQKIPFHATGEKGFYRIQ